MGGVGGDGAGDDGDLAAEDELLTLGSSGGDVVNGDGDGARGEKVSTRRVRFPLVLTLGLGPPLYVNSHMKVQAGGGPRSEVCGLFLRRTDGQTHVAAGVTVVRRKLEQSAERTLAGVRPSRVPVMARLQLLPGQVLARASRTPAAAVATKDRATANFILTVCFLFPEIWSGKDKYSWRGLSREESACKVSVEREGEGKPAGGWPAGTNIYVGRTYGAMVVALVSEFPLGEQAECAP